MTRKKLTTWIGAVASITIAGLLTGCSSHPNPLTVAKPNIAAQFLVNASQAAEKSLHVFQAPGGEYYGLCMAGKEKPSLCKKLYQAMSQYAKTTRHFKDVTIRDLTDQVVFNQLKQTYQRKQFDSV